ncbi:MFS transporter [Streptomyces rubiginosohelvolus]
MPPSHALETAPKDRAARHSGGEGGTRRRAWLFLAMAVCCGATVANVYIAQPLLDLFAQSLGASSASAGIVVTCAQLGYAVGILFLVPLGDVRRRRPLLLVLVCATVASLLLAAAAPGMAVLAAAAGLVGGATVIPQVLIPLAAEIAPADKRAAVVSQVQIGLMSGIIGSRVIGGVVGQALGWRSVYLLAAVLTAVAGAVTVALLPREEARKGMPYGQLLAGLPRLLRREPALRHACALHGLLFAAYTASATTLVLVLGDGPYHYGSAAAGLFGLLGLGGAFVAPWAGRFIDRKGAIPITVASLGLTLTSAVAYWLGASVLVLMAAGLVLASIAVQWSQIANQAHIFAHVPHARSRVNTVYMVVVFLSGAGAAALATAIYGAYGWSSVCLLQALLAALGLIVVPRALRHDRRTTTRT